jgi:hypothetical protein
MADESPIQNSLVTAAKQNSDKQEGARASWLAVIRQQKCSPQNDVTSQGRAAIVTTTAVCYSLTDKQGQAQVSCCTVITCILYTIYMSTKYYNEALSLQRSAEAARLLLHQNCSV